MRAQAGFTLIEALIVMGLVGVLAGVSAPVVAGGINRYNLTTAGQQVASTIRAARFQAVGRNMDLDVRFNFPADGQYQVVEDDGDVVGAVQTLPPGVRFNADPGDVEIEESGRMQTGICPCVITISNGDAAQNRTINVTQAGRVQLQ